MKTEGSRDPSTIRDVIHAVVAAHGVLRLYVSEAHDVRRPRVIEGVPKSFLPGRDGRDRLVIAVQSASEPVEIRLLVDRIARAERIDEEGHADPKCSAGELIAEPTLPTESARHPRAMPGRPQHATTKPGRLAPEALRPKAPASMPVRREAPPVERSGPELTHRGRGPQPNAPTVPDLRKPKQG